MKYASFVTKSPLACFSSALAKAASISRSVPARRTWSCSPSATAGGLCYLALYRGSLLAVGYALKCLTFSVMSVPATHILAVSVMASVNLDRIRQSQRCSYRHRQGGCSHHHQLIAEARITARIRWPPVGGCLDEHRPQNRPLPNSNYATNTKSRYPQPSCGVSAGLL